MAQHDYVIDNSTGANVRADINSALLAISSNNSGSSAPSTTYALQSFADTTNDMLKLRNEANNAFVNLRKFDGSLPLPDGSASNPSLFFDDDTNTGIFSSADNAINFATGGVERLEMSNTSTIFNDGGNDIDFAIEGDTDANLFYLNAGNDAIGIGTNAADTPLHVFKQLSDRTARFQRISTQFIDIKQTSGINSFTSTGKDFEIGTTDSQNLIFDTNDQPRIVVDSSGSVLIGTSSSVNVASSSSALLQVELSSGISAAFYSTANAANPSGVLALGHARNASGAALVDDDVVGEIRFAGGDGTDINTQAALIQAKIDGSPSSNNMPTDLIFFTNSGGASVAQKMIISKNGDIGAPSGDNIFDASDERLKENIIELSDCLNKINQLKPISYNYKTGWNKYTEGKTKYGFGAQTTQKVDELLIESFSDEDADLNGVKISNILRVNEKFIIPMLVKAVQELSAKVEALEAA